MSSEQKNLHKIQHSKAPTPSREHVTCAANLVVDSVIEAWHAREYGGLQLLHVLQQLQHITAVEPHRAAAVHGSHHRDALIDVRQG